MYGYQRGRVAGGRDGLGGWDRCMYTVVYGMIGQWGQFYSSENSTQYSVMIYVGKKI